MKQFISKMLLVLLIVSLLSTTVHGIYGSNWIVMTEIRINTSGETDEQSVDLPWSKGGKQPPSYTWSEFEALSAEQKEAFYKWFESAEAFEEWQMKAQGLAVPAKKPWEEEGGKEPSAYTWTEFQALSAEQQEMFFSWFSSPEEFLAWQNWAQENDIPAERPWEKEGAKAPTSYTWSEFQALSAEQQEMFFDWFASADDFIAWQTWAQENDVQQTNVNSSPDTAADESSKRKVDLLLVVGSAVSVLLIIVVHMVFRLRRTRGKDNNAQ